MHGILRGSARLFATPFKFRFQLHVFVCVLAILFLSTNDGTNAFQIANVGIPSPASSGTKFTKLHVKEHAGGVERTGAVNAEAGINGSTLEEKETQGFAPVTEMERETEYRPNSMKAAFLETGKVPYGEESRKYRRTIYDHGDWVNHRSNDRFLENLSTVFTSGVVRQLLFEVGCVASSALVVCAWNAALGGYVDFDGVHHDGILFQGTGVAKGILAVLPVAPFTVASPALGLLLVFRTNTSYQRWVEARSAWTRISTQGQNILRMAATFSSEIEVPRMASQLEPETNLGDGDAMPNDEVRKAKASLRDVSIRSYVFLRTLQQHLRGPEEEAAYIRDVQQSGLSDLDVNDLLYTATHRPSWALQDLSASINRLPIDEKRRVEIDKSAVIMGDAMGTAESIFRSPVPLVYTRHTARFLSLYLLLLPMALWDSFGTSWNHILLVPCSAIIALFLFGIEELAVQLEEPFSILPIEIFVTGTRENGEQMQKWFSRSMLV